MPGKSASPDAGVREAQRAIKELGALGVQIYTNVAGKPLDRPEYEPFWKIMNDLGKPPGITPGYSCIGRMRGLAELRGLMLGLRHADRMFSA